MSRSPPPGSWYPSQGSISGPPPMPTNPDRRSPGYNHGPPPDWYKWHDPNRRRSPSPQRNGSPRDHLAQRPSSPLDDRNSLHRITSPRNDRPPSPKSFQHSLLQERPLSPRREVHLSPKRERLSSPRVDRPQNSPRRLHSPSLEMRHSPRRERPLSPRRERPLSPQRDRPLSPRRDRPLSPRRERPLSPRRDRPPSPRRDRPPSPRRDRPPSPRRERPPSPRRDRPPSPRRDRLPSPRRDRPPSPRRDRPPSPRRDRPPSPRRERPLSPQRERPLSPRRDARLVQWRSRSPPRLRGPPPPHDWKRRSRSPPHWIRRSPPRYGPPRGRSPPRSYWGPPPPEWDRYRPPPYSSRRSPPRWLPPSSQPWDRRISQPPSPAPLPPPRDRYPTSGPTQESTPKSGFSSKLDDKPDNKGADGVLPLADEKEDDIESYDLPDYDADVGTGQKYVVAVSGYFCKICHKFYNSELSARGTHCKSRSHYDKFSKWLSDKKEAALLRKRTEVPASDETVEGEPPAKQIKLESDAGAQPAEEPDSKYDPSQPTQPEPVANTSEEVDVSDVDVSKENETKPEDKAADSVMEVSSLSEESGAAQTEDSADDTTSQANGEAKKAVVDATLQNLKKLKVSEIKANLEKRGVKATGLKPHLLKCLEKVLLEESTAVASETEENAEEEQKVNEEQKPGGADNKANSNEGIMCVLKLVESDVEPENRKAQWITERELERELLQLDGVKSVKSLKSKRTRLFNGRRTNVEWTITLMYDGEVAEDGLSFSIPSHQHCPFVATLVDN